MSEEIKKLLKPFSSRTSNIYIEKAIQRQISWKLMNSFFILFFCILVYIQRFHSKPDLWFFFEFPSRFLLNYYFTIFCTLCFIYIFSNYHTQPPELYFFCALLWNIKWPPPPITIHSLYINFLFDFYRSPQSTIHFLHW